MNDRRVNFWAGQRGRGSRCVYRGRCVGHASSDSAIHYDRLRRPTGRRADENFSPDGTFRSGECSDVTSTKYGMQRKECVCRSAATREHGEKLSGGAKLLPPRCVSAAASARVIFSAACVLLILTHTLRVLPCCAPPFVRSIGSGSV